MRHGKRFNHLGRTSPHRKSMLANMASSLIIHKRLTTTVAKAKALRQYVEPLITRSKEDSTHSRRVVFSYLRDKDSSRVLFDEVAEKVAERPGGYTRIIKLGNRLGDNAEMCMIELVDFNEVYNQEEKQSRGKTRRSRRGGKKKSSDTDQATAATETLTEEASSTEQTVEASQAEEVQIEEEESNTAESEAQEEETVELSGEEVVEDATEAETTPEVEASSEAEVQAESEDQSKEEETPSTDEDEEKPKE